MSDDGDRGECPQCGGYGLHYRCWDCGGEGYRELYDDDPLYYDEGDTETCQTCHGKGGWWVCKSGCMKEEETL